MPTVRKTGGRAEFNAIIGQINALIADLTSVRSNLVLGLDDDGSVITEIGNAISDVTAVRDEVVNLVADIAAVRDEVVNLVADVAAVLAQFEHAAVGFANLANGTTAGKLKTQVDIDFRINGSLYAKAATDDLWDLSAEVDTGAGVYRAYWLYLDSSGAASIAAGGDQASAAAAIGDLPALSDTKSVVGAFVASPSCDFNGAGGLSGQGTIYNGFPGTLGLTAADPAAQTSSDPAAISASAPSATAADPDALTSETITQINA